MNTSVQLETLDLSELDKDSFVLIHVDVGRMPPKRVRNYFERFRNEFKLCQMLDEREIQYALIANRRNEKEVAVKKSPIFDCDVEEQMEKSSKEIMDDMKKDLRYFKDSFPQTREKGKENSVLLEESIEAYERAKP